MTTSISSPALDAEPGDDILWWGGWDDTAGDFATMLCRTADEAQEEIDRLGSTASLRRAHGHELGPVPGDPFFADADDCPFCRYARPLPPPDATACRDGQGEVWLAITDPDGSEPPTWMPVQDWKLTPAGEPAGTLFRVGLCWDHLAVQHGPIAFDPQLDPRRSRPEVTWLMVEAYSATLTADESPLLAAVPAGPGSGATPVSGDLEDLLIELETEPHFLGGGARLLLSEAPLPGGGDPAADAAEWLANLAPRAYPAEEPQDASDRWVVDLHGVSVSATLRRDGTVYLHIDTSDAIGPEGPIRGVSVEVNGSGYENDLDLR